MTIAAVLALVLTAPETSVSPAPPVLILVRMEGSESFQASQTRLHDELTLLLDGFMLISTPVEVEGFPQKPLAEQLSAVLQLSQANGAVAVVWMAEPMAGQLMLHLVAIGTGRTLVRTIDFDRKSRSESALAVMLRELLGTAFLYERPQEVPAEVRTVVREVRTQMSQAAEVAAPQVLPAPIKPPADPLFRFAAGATLQVGLSDQPIPTARFGGALSGTVRAGPLNVGLEVGFATVRSRLVAQTWLDSTSVPVDASVAKYFGTESLLLGPRVAVGVEPTWTSVSGTPRMFSAGARGTMGVEALGGAGPWRFVARIEIENRLRRVEVAELPGEVVVWRLPPLSVRTLLGISWEGF